MVNIVLKKQYLYTLSFYKMSLKFKKEKIDFVSMYNADQNYRTALLVTYSLERKGNL